MLEKSNKSSGSGQAGRLPPWPARNQRDNELMALWLNEGLDEFKRGYLIISASISTISSISAILAPMTTPSSGSSGR
jgi:hypothetical protein